MSDYPLLRNIFSPFDVKRLSVEELGQLAAEIREAICDQVSKTGGHLAPNLGVVELTLALHYVFDFSHDRLLFDVGHQCYPHKLLTGRRHKLSGLRQRNGIAGFPEPRESDFDLFSVGHAGTGVSTAIIFSYHSSRSPGKPRSRCQYTRISSAVSEFSGPK